MSNADDSPASENGREDRSGPDQASPESGSEGPDEPTSGGGSRLDLDLDLGSSDSSSDDSSGFSLPDPSSVGRDDEEDDRESRDADDDPETGGPPTPPDESAPGGLDASRLGDDDTDPEAPPAQNAPPNQTPADDSLFSDGTDETEAPDVAVDDEPSDEEVLELDDDDLIVESAEQEETDLSDDVELEAAPVDEPTSGDDKPTSLSENSTDAEDDAGEASVGTDSGGLSNLADEMEESASDGPTSGLHEEPPLERDDDQTPADGFDDYQATSISNDDDSGTVEQAAPAVGSSDDGTVEHAAPAVDGMGPGGGDADASASPPTDEDDAPAVVSSPASSTPADEADAPESDDGGRSGGAGSEPPSSPPSAASQSGAAPKNPPPPEQTGRGATGSSPSPDPTAEASLDEDIGGEHNFGSQETDLFDSPFEHDPIAPRVNVLEGPSSGQEFLLNKLRNAIGRSTNNTVSIPDEAMSRQHVEIIRNPDDTYTIRDLQSVNGTLLNGTKIREADLFHGDRIEVGQTTLQFVIPGQRPGDEDERQRHIERASDDEHDQRAPQRAVAVPPGARADDTLATWLNRIIVGALVLLVPLAGTFLYLTLNEPVAQSATATTEKREARNAYLAGVEAVKRRAWQKAHQHFQKAKQLDPDVGDVDAQLERLTSEKEAQKSLQTARTALKKGDEARALQLAKSVPRESVYYEDAREIVRRQHRKQRISALYGKAEDQFDEENYQAALATIQRILNTIPNHGDALNLRRRILRKTDANLNAAKEKAKRQAKQKPKQKEKAPTEKRSDPEPRAAASERSSDGDDSWLIDDSSEDESAGSGGDHSGSGGGGSRVVNFTKGFTLYKQKDFDAAVAHFDEAAKRSSSAVGKRAESAAEQIRRFRKHYQAGQKALSSGRWQSAISSYRKALRSDKKVASSGYFTSELKANIARAHAEIGLKAVGSGDYTGGFDAYKKASNYDASAGKVRDLRKRLEKKARSMYIQAAAKRKTDPGKTAAMCRTIMAIVPKDSKNYKKARTLLDEL